MLRMTLRFTPAQNRTLQQLSAKLGIDKTNIIRLAVARLAESEGIFNKPERKS